MQHTFLCVCVCVCDVGTPINHQREKIWINIIILPFLCDTRSTRRTYASNGNWRKKKINMYRSIFFLRYVHCRNNGVACKREKFEYRDNVRWRFFFICSSSTNHIMVSNLIRACVCPEVYSCNWTSCFLIYKIRLMCVRTSLMRRRHADWIGGQKNRVMAQRVKVDLVRSSHLCISHHLPLIMTQNLSRRFYHRLLFIIYLIWLRHKYITSSHSAIADNNKCHGWFWISKNTVVGKSQPDSSIWLLLALLLLALLLLQLS